MAKKLERVFIHRRADGAKGGCCIAKKVGHSMFYWNGKAWSSTAAVYSYSEAKKKIKRFRETPVNELVGKVESDISEILDRVAAFHRVDESTQGGITTAELVNIFTNEIKQRFET